MSSFHFGTIRKERVMHWLQNNLIASCLTFLIFPNHITLLCLYQIKAQLGNDEQSRV